MPNCRPGDQLSFFANHNLSHQGVQQVAQLSRLLPGDGSLPAGLLAEAQAFLDSEFASAFHLDSGLLCKPYGCQPRLWRVQFTEDLPVEVGAGSVANLEGWDNSEAVVERSRLHHGLYGLRWKSSNGRIENNQIATNYIEVTPLLFCK